jgi:hypothetical protein
VKNNTTFIQTNIHSILSFTYGRSGFLDFQFFRRESDEERFLTTALGRPVCVSRMMDLFLTLTELLKSPTRDRTLR